MRKTLLLVSFLTGVVAVKAQVTMSDTLGRVQNNFFVIERAAQEYFGTKYASNGGQPTFKTKYTSTDSGSVAFQKIDGEWAKYNRWAWYWRDRHLPDGSFPDVDSISKVHPYCPVHLKRAGEPAWACINQTTCTGGYNGMGRTKCVAFHPTDPKTFYVGAPIGGLWKTSDGGLTYSQLTDSLPYVAAGTVAVDFDNPNTIYISVSDNGGWWNYSLGIYKSNDGGRSWNPTGLKWTFNDQVAVYAMAMSPSNSQALIITASNGLWRTTNGGTNWTRVRTGSHTDVKYRPGDGQTVYASSDDYYGSSEVFRSTNGGISWTKITSFGVAHNTIRLAVSPANPDMLVAQLTANKALYVSKDQGGTFTQKSTVNETAIIGISPTNENILYSGYVNVYRSEDGGATWRKATEWYGGTALPEVHADQQFVAFNPLNNLLYFCNDGGLYQYTEPLKAWRELSNGLVITQYYRVANAQTDPVMLIGGTQDNGGRMRNPNGTWSATNGGDAMEVAVDPTDYRISYSTYCYGELFRTTNNWRTNTKISDNIPGKPKGEWVTPYVLDPQDSKVIVAGYDEVYRSTDRGTTWTKISSLAAGNLECVAVATGNSAIIYASRGNKLFATTNTGGSWETTTGPNTSERITSIAIDPANPQHLVITYGGYTAGKRVYRSTDGGATFKNISGTLPTVPASVAMFQVATDGRVFVGTDAGVFTRDNTMSDWVRHGAGLPNTSVLDLDIQYPAMKLRCGTHGRGIWEVDLPGVLVNEVPVVSISQPASGTVFSGAPLQVTATASDADGSISKVEFFVNGTSLGVVTGVPYTVTIKALMAGDVIVTARAYDDKNAVGESSPVAISTSCPTGYVTKETSIGTPGSWNNSGNDFTKVFDGNTSTFFDSPDGNGAWVGMDMGQPRPITGVRVFPRTQSATRMTGARIQGANKADFSDSVTMFTLPLINQTDWHCIVIADTNSYQYVRYLSPDGGFCNVAEMEILTPIVKQSMVLAKGWNLISMNVAPSDSSITSVFNALDVEEAKTMDAFWRNGQPGAFNSLTTIRAGEGYFVNLNEEGTLEVTGVPVRFSRFQIFPFSNWCIIGVPFQTSTAFATHFDASNCTVIKDLEGFWVPNGTMNSIENMEPGKGYLIKRP